MKRSSGRRWRNGKAVVPARRVADGLGMTTESLRAWRRQLGGAEGCAVHGRGRQAACHRPDRPGTASGGAPAARPAPKCDQPARHFKKGRRDFCRPKREHFAVIEALEEIYPVSDLCAALRRVTRRLLLLASTGAERAGARRHRPGGRDRRALRATSPHLRQVHGYTGRCAGQATPAAGTGWPRLMRGRGIAGRVRGRRRPGTTDSDHEQPIAPNRLGQREAPVERPNEVWAADITYVSHRRGLAVSGGRARSG